MNLLPSSTVRLIASSQVITSVSSVVKELVENSLDAGATSIEIKLDGWGLERIEVRDNGCGIKPEDAPFVAQPHYTSKISSDDDLKSLHTYGFRGEALGSLSSVSSVSVLTKTEADQVGMLYTLECNGKIGATQPKPAATGTTIIASNLFKNLPVRKQFSSNSRKCKDELKRVEDLVMAYGLVHPSLRISLRHNKAVIWQKSKVSNHRTALLSVFGTTLLAQMGVVEFHDDNLCSIQVMGYLPRPGSDLEVTGRAVNDRCFVFFNGRPVNMKQISRLIKQYYNSHTSASNRYPVAFLSIKVPPEDLDVNLEPNKTRVMLTNKDEVMTLLTNLLEEFYSDEKNKISERKKTNPSNGAEKGTSASKNGIHINEDACNGGVPCVQTASTGNVNALNGDIQVANSCALNGEVSVCTSNNNNKESNDHGSSAHLDENSLFEITQNKEHSAQAKNDAECHLNCNISNESTSNEHDLSKDESSCHENTNKKIQDADKHTYKSPISAEVETDTNVNGHVDKAASTGQEESNTLVQVDSLLTSSSPDSTELCDTLSDKSLCEIIDIANSVHNSSKILLGTEQSSVTENDLENNNGISSLNRDDQSKSKETSAAKMLKNGDNSKAVTSDKCSGKSKDLPHNRALTCTAPSMSHSVENLFSVDLDDLFNDSDLDVTSANSCLEASSALNHVQTAEKSKPSEISTNKGSVSVEKSLTLVPSGTVSVSCSDKDWSMGRGIVDKQGKPMEPVCLLTPGPPRQPLVTCNKTPVAPLHGKRKHSSDQQSRLSLSSKKIKKSPEITNQPLINKVMSPNPMQRKLLYKKKEIPFCMNALKELSNKRKKELRSVEEDSNSDHLVGRLDPWGVWLLQRGGDLICVNQYRIQEQLLFQRLMECHSLPKERIHQPIALNERIVGGPECWRTLCGMSSKCDPPDTTRFIDDERLTANGFDVCLKTDSDSGETKLELYKMSTSIPFYGVPDLVEVLELVIRQKDDSESNSLSSCRPFKVIHYLQGEAVRVARGLSSRMNRSEVSDIISRMKKKIPEDTITCVHGRPFFKTIAQIPKE